MSFTGAPVYTSEWVADGAMYQTNEGFFIGVVSETDVQHEARRIVRSGLKNVLEWIGQPTLTGRDLIERLKNAE